MRGLGFVMLQMGVLGCVACVVLSGQTDLPGLANAAIASAALFVVGVALVTLP